MLLRGLFLSLCIGHASAQVFASLDIGIAALTGLGTDCMSALNTTISCPGILFAASRDRGRLHLGQDTLTDLCTAKCLSDLKAVKKAITANCTPVDTIYHPGEGVTYPASYFADLFQYTYNQTCRQDPTTGQFCDVISVEKANNGTLAGDWSCSYCMLRAYQLQARSYFGYDEATPSYFSSLLSSCKTSGYSYTTPAPYTVSGASIPATATPTAAASCPRVYKVQANDTANTVALAQNTSTFSIYGPNAIQDRYGFLQVNRTLCLLGECKLYQVQDNDTCDSILANYTSTYTIPPQFFMAWNPNIDALCRNIGKFVGDYICMTRPEGISNPTYDDVTTTLTSATASVSSTSTSTSMLPTASGVKSGCLKYRNYEAPLLIEDAFYQPTQRTFDKSGTNRCGFLSRHYNVSMAELKAWNPTLDTSSANCTLPPGYSYCVDRKTKVGLNDTELNAWFL